MLQGRIAWSSVWYDELTVEDVDNLYELGLLDMGEADQLLSRIKNNE